MGFNSTVVSQILKLVPRHEFERLANGHDGARRSDALSRWSQFVALSVGQLGSRESLRDIEATLRSQSRHRYHLGSQSVSRSSLSRANDRLSSAFYESLFRALHRRCQGHVPGHRFRFKGKVLSLDGTLIDLSMKVFPWADYNRRKAALKLHVGLDHDGLIPAFASLTGGSDSEMAAVEGWALPPGSVLVFDRGYNNYSWHKALTDKGFVWVTRMRRKARYRVVERRAVARRSPITSDQLIEYTGKKARHEPLHRIRRIGYRDPVSKKHYVFITNQLHWSPQTIADLYQQRWQIELFFKWLKHNLKIRTFLGNSENAVKTQIFVALCLYLVLAFLKFRSGLHQSLQQILRLLQLNLFIRQPLVALFTAPPDKPPPDDQLRLALVRH